MPDLSTPDNLDDVPPALAAVMQRGREVALAYLMAHDYRMLIPPLVDYLETLTAGDRDLDVETFKITDTLSGRTLGIRADQTPQIARYDLTANGDARAAIRRYCYCGPVLRTRPAQAWQSRESMQLGGELFGAPAPSGDWEIICMVLGVLRALGLSDVAIDIGHAGLFHRIIAETETAMTVEKQKELITHITQRDTAAVQSLPADGAIRPATAAAMQVLAQTHGDRDGLAAAKDALPAVAADALDELAYLARQLDHDGTDVGVNLSDLGSYGYHTGVVFTVTHGKHILARGGRYNSGVGFSADLRLVAPLLETTAATAAVAVPLVADDRQWAAAVARLRQQGRRIRFVHGDGDELSSPPYLCKEDDDWLVREQ